MTERIAELLENFFKFNCGIVYFVYDKCVGNVCFVCAVERDLRADFSACNTVYNDESSSRNAERFENTAGKIEISGCVDKVDLCIFPHQICNGRANGEASFDGFGVVVANCVAFFNFAESVCAVGYIEHCFRNTCFAYAGVAEQADVSDILCGNFSHSVQAP